MEDSQRSGSVQSTGGSSSGPPPPSSSSASPGQSTVTILSATAVNLAVIVAAALSVRHLIPDWKDHPCEWRAIVPLCFAFGAMAAVALSVEKITAIGSLIRRGRVARANGDHDPPQR